MWVQIEENGTVKSDRWVEDEQLDDMRSRIEILENVVACLLNPKERVSEVVREQMHDLENRVRR